jgi:malate permease and related proteins
MENFIVIGIALLLGAATKRLFALPQKAPQWINQFIIYVALPAVILRQLPASQFHSNAILPIIIPWLFFAITLFAVHTVSERMQWPRDVKGALLMLIPMGNTSYLGYPMVRAFFGEPGMPYAIVFDQIGNFLLLAVFAPIILARFGNQVTDASWRAIGKRIISFPPFIALCIALLLLRGVTLPTLIDNGLMLLGKTMAPLAMFIIGLQLSARVPRELRAPLSFALGMKLLLSPLLALVICIASSALFTTKDSLALQVTVFEAAMPTMVTAAILAMAAGLAPRLCSAAIGFGLCCSLLSLPLWFLLTNWLMV